MAKISQNQKVINFLQANPLKRFTVREIAQALVNQYPEDYREKRDNPRFIDDTDFLSQIEKEIASKKDQFTTVCPHIFWQDKPRPRVYWYNPDNKQSNENDVFNNDNLIEKESINETNKIINDLTELKLYPLLVEFLKTELKIYCLRIDEKRSKNQRGNGGNKWLHPDIVAMQAVDKEWHELIKTCVKRGGGQSVRLYSFEVKKELNSSNVRMSFFQAVSNSSWANEGYLVAVDIANNIEQELRMLSALHGIGVILLNIKNPTESEILLPAIARPAIDWQTVNRIVIENEDFKDFVELVSIYYQTGTIRYQDWNKI